MPQDAEFPSIARAYKARRKLTQLEIPSWGWFILGGYLAVTAGQGVAQSYFVYSVVIDQVPVVSTAINTAFNAVLGGIFPPVLVACGLLTLARVMRVGAQMSDDLAGTV